MTSCMEEAVMRVKPAMSMTLGTRSTKVKRGSLPLSALTQR